MLKKFFFNYMIKRLLKFAFYKGFDAGLKYPLEMELDIADLYTKQEFDSYIKKYWSEYIIEKK